EIARVLMQDRGKHTVNQHRSCKLIAFHCHEALSKSAPTLAVERDTVRGLRDARLQDVSEVRAVVGVLMPGYVEFFAGGQGAGVFRLVVGGHEIGNDEE